jgi:hypothetical protein
MCIFNEDAEVHNTKIFAGKTQDGLHQLTVYANTVDAENRKTNNAMILPFPANAGIIDVINAHRVSANSDIIQVLDFQDYKQFFDNCYACFPREDKNRKKDISNGEISGDVNLVHLEVVQVGGYNVSIARTLEHIRDIDPNFFTVKDNIYEILRANYATGFAFLICSFDTTKKISTEETPPLAYVHKMSSTGKLFVPTLHEHKEVGFMDKFLAKFNASSDLPKWDHQIYLLNAKHSNADKQAKDMHAVHLYRLNQKLPSPLEACKTFSLATIVGKHKNEDIHVEML